MKLLGKLSKLHPLIKMDRCGFKLESDWCIRDEAKFIFLLFIAIWHLSSNLVGTLRQPRFDIRTMCYCVKNPLQVRQLQLYSRLTRRCYSATISGTITMTRHDGAVPTQSAPRKQTFTVTYDRIHHTILEHLARAKTVWHSRYMWDSDISKSILFADMLTSVNTVLTLISNLYCVATQFLP